MKKCNVEGCELKYRCSGYCNMHYLRLKHHGDVNAKRRKGHIRVDGYVAVKHGGERQYEHIRIAEKAIGKPLPSGAEVHHANENKSDNTPSNLVICPDAKYHRLLHMRMRAVSAGYPAHYRRCSICKKYDDPAVLYIKPNGNHPRHRTCRNRTVKFKVPQNSAILREAL